jgi:hypothetical protein
MGGSAMSYGLSDDMQWLADRCDISMGDTIAQACATIRHYIEDQDAWISIYVTNSTWERGEIERLKEKISGYEFARKKLQERVVVAESTVETMAVALSNMADELCQSQEALSKPECWLCQRAHIERGHPTEIQTKSFALVDSQPGDSLQRHEKLMPVPERWVEIEGPQPWERDVGCYCDLIEGSCAHCIRLTQIKAQNPEPLMPNNASEPVLPPQQAPFSGEGVIPCACGRDPRTCGHWA